MTIFNPARTGSQGWMRAGAAGLLVAAGMLGSAGVVLAQDSVVVEMTGDLRFAPETVRISAGDRVEWRNTSGTVHTATADPEQAADPANVRLPEGAEPFDSGIVPSGGTYGHTFEVAGRYRYVCLPHEAAGMIGEIIVEE